MDKKEYAGEATKDFERMAEEYDVEFPIPPQETRMIKWIAIGLLVVGLLVFSETARAIEKDVCWYAEGVPCKESL